MNVRLFLERNGKRIWTAQMRGSEATLGRAVGCTIRIPSSEVSRLHCRLRIEDDLVTAEDLESVNGTFLNGVPLDGVEFVRPGDRLSLGSVTFVVEYPLTETASRRLSGEVDYEVEEDEENEVVAEPPADAEAESHEVSQDELAGSQDEEADEEMVVLDDKEEMHLPEGGDLRDFLIELDDNDERS